jgi:hypothetical protein
MVLLDMHNFFHMEDAFPLDQAKRPTNTETQQSYLGYIQGNKRGASKAVSSTAVR